MPSGHLDGLGAAHIADEPQRAESDEDYASDFDDVSVGVTQTLDVCEETSSPSDGASWVLDGTLDNFLFQFFQSAGDALAFTYCQYIP